MRFIGDASVYCSGDDAVATVLNLVQQHLMMCVSCFDGANRTVPCYDALWHSVPPMLLYKHRHSYHT
jgi:hypothetical protein